MGEAGIVSYEYLFYEVLYLGFLAEVCCIWYSGYDVLYASFLGV